MDFDILEKWNKRKPNNRFPTEADLATISETLMSIRLEAHSRLYRDRKDSPSDREKLGKILTWLFKYPDIMTNEGVWMSPAGFVPLNEVASLPQLRNQWTEQDVRQFIEDQEEKTFVLLKDVLGQVYIKAIDERNDVGKVGMGLLVKQAPAFDEKLTKTLFWALRHADKIKRLRKDNYGYIQLSTVLKFEQFRQWTAKDIYQLAEYYRICRGYELFEIKTGTEKKSGKVLIRAYYGHSIKVPKAYKKIKHPSSEEVAVAIYGLTLESEKWEDVKEEGLSRCKGQKKKEIRNIWFHNVEPTLEEVEAGGKQIFVFVDVMKAMKDGYKFFRAANNFLGTPGNEGGFLPPKYFKKVVDFKTGEELEYNKD